MAKYTATNAEGRTITLEGDAPPTEKDFDDAFSAIGPMRDDPADTGRDYSLFQSEFQSPQLPPGVNTDFKKGLLTNEPVDSLSGTAGRIALPTIGSMAGAATGGVAGAATLPLAGPLPAWAGAMYGSGAGAAGGEGLRQGMVNAYSALRGTQPTAPGESISRTVNQGLIGAAGEGLAQGAIKAAPYAAKAGGQFVKVMTNADARAGEHMLAEPGRFFNAPSLEGAGKQFGNYMDQSGVTNGPMGAVKYTGKRTPGREAKFDLIDSALNDISTWKTAGTSSDPLTGAVSNSVPAKPDLNKLVVAREQARKLAETPAMRNELAKSELASVYSNIEELDAAIEQLSPGYADIRAGYRDAKTADTFSNILPMNKHGQPNGLLPMIAGQFIGGASLYTHNPAYLALAPLFSPAAYGFATKATYVVSKAVPPNVAVPAAAAGLSDYYSRQR